MKSILFLLLACQSTLTLASQVVFESIGQPSITFDLSRNLYYQGDTVAPLTPCAALGLVECLRIRNSVLAVTENLLLANPKLAKVKLADSHELLALPIIHQYTVLGRKVSGYLISIDTLPNRHPADYVFYSKAEGIVSFTLNGTAYWSTTPCGLFTPKECLDKTAK